MKRKQKNVESKKWLEGELENTHLQATCFCGQFVVSGVGNDAREEWNCVIAGTVKLLEYFPKDLRSFIKYLKN